MMIRCATLIHRNGHAQKLDYQILDVSPILFTLKFDVDEPSLYLPN